MVYELPDLPYEYNALEPYIDAKTMEIHHTKHHQAYLDKLNAAIEKYPNLKKKSAEELISDLEVVPSEIRTIVRNNGGGHVNHSLFWQILSPGKQSSMGEIEQKIIEAYGSFESFKNLFTETAMSRFGSGWAWLVVNDAGDLEILSTANQDNPMSEGKIPILCLDVWEHAYYLNYQNRRKDYVDAFFNIIDWGRVNELYESLVSE